MLNQLRDAAKTRIAKLFLIILGVSFLGWGAGRWSSPQDAVLIVGKDLIRYDAFRREYELAFTNLQRQSNVAIDRDTAAAYGLPNQVATTLAMRSAFKQRARALGLTASEEAVARYLAGIDAFIDPFTGRFDQDSYAQRLYQAGTTPKLFEQEVAEDIIGRQIGAALLSGLRPPDVLVEARLRYQNEERALSIVVIPADTPLEVAEPTQGELESFFAEQQPRYAEPERRAFSVVMLDVEGFARDAPVDDELLEAAYEQERGQLGAPERRDIVELSASDEATAAAAAQRLRAGEDAEAVAAELELPPPVAYDDALPTDLLSTAIGEAAFAVPEGEVSDPIDGGISWFVFRIDDVIEGEQLSFEEAAPALREELARENADDLLFDALDAYEAARGGGVALADAAVAARLPVISYGLTDARGGDVDGVVTDLFMQHPEILAAAFEASTPGQTTDLRELGEDGGDGYFAVRLDRIAPAAAPPLEEIEARVRADYAARARAEALDAIADRARAALEEGAGPSAAAAATAESATGETSRLKRTEPTPTVTPQLLAAAFAAEPGAVVSGPTYDGGRAVARVDSVSLDAVPAGGSEDGSPSPLEQGRARLTLEVANDLDAMFQTALRDAYPVRLDERLLAQATGVEPPQ